MPANPFPWPVPPPDPVVNFGAVWMPHGYRVVWRDLTERYCAIGPGDWESLDTVDRFQARRMAIAHAGRVTVEEREP